MDAFCLLRHRMTQLEGEARTLREALSGAEQRAAAAIAKADVLQRAVAQVCHAASRAVAACCLHGRRIVQASGWLMPLSLTAAT